MGAYLSNPITEKISEDNENYRFSVGASSMQGWRVSQEDAHNAIINYDQGCSFFAVYDGHGGHEVAAYTAMHLPKFIKDSPEFKKGLYSKALEESFIGFDETITKEEVIAVLKKLMHKDDEEEDEADDPHEVDHLYQEASMPIEDVIARFKEGEGPTNKNLAKVVVPECSSQRKPKSPFLSGKRSQSGNGINRHTRFQESEESTEMEKDEEKEEEELNGKTPHENGNDSKEEDKNTLNGEADPSEVKEETLTNGKESDTEKSYKSTPVSSKGKGKGKGKGKSNQITVKPKTDGEGEEEAEPMSEVPKKIKKSAEELYRKITLTDGNDDEEGSSEEEEDEDAFPNAKDSSDDDDDDDDLDGEEDSEPDTEDDGDDDDDDDCELMGPSKIKEEPGSDSGCTAVVGLIVKDELFVANAGDSRCVVCRNGEAIEMSIDHKPEDDIEKERIVKAGGNVTNDGRVDGGLNLSRALGDHAYKLKKTLPLIEQMISPQPDIRTLKLDPKTDTFIILACDGIWNSMSSQEVVDFIKPRIEQNPDKLSSICEELFDVCLAPDTSGDGTGCDNMTAVIIKVKDSYNSLNEPSSCKRADIESESTQNSKRRKTDNLKSEKAAGSSSNTGEPEENKNSTKEEVSADSS
ncbi:protein phosphatase 1G [Lepeophtheirus salmonis]|uniref:protein phosphatase 1G n=1 Tax=Lepeophtheirus salmonis TaxID=72036 RepID=UPI001AE69283|nr:probable protein phosphatase CG10417 [Lepeophtheirus salmonis]